MLCLVDYYVVRISDRFIA